MKQARSEQIIVDGEDTVKLRDCCLNDMIVWDKYDIRITELPTRENGMVIRGRIQTYGQLLAEPVWWQSSELDTTVERSEAIAIQ